VLSALYLTGAVECHADSTLGRVRIYFLHVGRNEEELRWLQEKQHL